MRFRGANLDVARMGRLFDTAGYRLKIMQFKDIDFQSDNYEGRNILYQSAEDRGLLYKDYIEDILLGLNFQGARLIPDIYKFRAHHNKVFMEILRSLSNCPDLQGISSHAYGTLEDFMSDLDRLPTCFVLKPASGSLSTGIRFKEGRRSQLRYARRLSSSLNLLDFAKRALNTIITKDYRKKSLHRRKFIVQEFVPGLEGDFKVLVYGKKYYVLQRRNRKHDFRASGSGVFSFPVVPPSGLLDFAAAIFNYFRVPFISLDIAKCGDAYVLLEFQFLCFGNYTIERSKFYFSAMTPNNWAKIDEKPDLEREFVASIVHYLKDNEQ